MIEGPQVTAPDEGRHADVVGIVPAAGRSARIGSPKALLNADGPNFVTRVVGTLLQGGCSQVRVVVREDPGVVSAAAQQAGADVRVQPNPDDPITGGLQGAIDASVADLSPDTLVVVLPVDHPLVDALTVRALIDAWRDAVPTNAQAVITPRYAAALGWPRVAAVSEASSISGPVAPVGVEVTDRGVVRDIDTLADYRRAFPQAWRKRFHAR